MLVSQENLIYKFLLELRKQKLYAAEEMSYEFASWFFSLD